MFRIWPDAGADGSEFPSGGGEGDDDPGAQRLRENHPLPPADQGAFSGEGKRLYPEQEYLRAGAEGFRQRRRHRPAAQYGCGGHHRRGAGFLRAHAAPEVLRRHDGTGPGEGEKRHGDHQRVEAPGTPHRDSFRRAAAACLDRHGAGPGAEVSVPGRTDDISGYPLPDPDPGAGAEAQPGVRDDCGYGTP